MWWKNRSYLQVEKVGENNGDHILKKKPVENWPFSLRNHDSPDTTIRSNSRSGLNVEASCTMAGETWQEAIPDSGRDRNWSCRHRCSMWMRSSSPGREWTAPNPAVEDSITQTTIIGFNYIYITFDILFLPTESIENEIKVLLKFIVKSNHIKKCLNYTPTTSEAELELSWCPAVLYAVVRTCTTYLWTPETSLGQFPANQWAAKDTETDSFLWNYTEASIIACTCAG